ncbi:MAG: tyrosine-type recombinase/integrase [Candidatus Melainabacteria bacterium]|nr:tyrosine-type recombinase/integrase [Candidatus Melainabacteria bacterium]
MPRLTKKFIENEIRPPSRGQVFYRDDLLNGFALRVTHGSMSYVVECRINGINRRVTIGPHGPLTPEVARREAQKLLASMKTGHDPKVEEMKNKIATVTLAEVFQHYLATRTLRPNSIRSFKHVLKRCLGDWLDKPIACITKEMIIARHRELTKPTRQKTSGRAQANLAMEILGILLNFAANTYEIDGKPVIQNNPVRALSQIRAWHRIPRRQTLIPDQKLARWYQAVRSLRSKVVRDYILLLLFTGLRRNEAATLRWSDIDMESRVLTIKAEVAKNQREHRLPLSDFLFQLLAVRKQAAANSEYVFPALGGRGHLKHPSYAVWLVTQRCEYRFTIHDLRRNFLSAADMLGVPHYALKKLANHVSGADVTSGYIVVDAERLRIYCP